MSRPKTYAVGLLSVALAVLATACGDGGGDSGPVGEPVAGGNAIVGIRSDFGGFNPVTHGSVVTDEVLKYMLFTPLIQYDENLGVRPYLAESWELTDDAVTFKIRQGVTWHDGRPVTAEDVKFTFDLAKNPESAAGIITAYLGMVESATVVDPQTIRFDFVAPHGQALEDFWWAPVPKHLLESVAPAQLAQAPFNQNPVGSGPFKFVSWQQGQTLVLEKNATFPAALGGPPRLDRVTFRIIPEATIRLTELISGTTHMDLSILPSEANQAQQQGGGVEIKEVPSREFAYIGWNNERPPFNDPLVRRALTMAVDRDQIMEALLFGFASPVGSVIPPFSPMSPDLQPLPFDAAGARQLLAQAGWRDTNGDQILDKGGQPLRFTIITNAANQLFQDIATVVQQQLKTAGVDAQIRTLEFQTMLQQHRSRDYEAIITNWSWDYFRPDPSPLFSCEQARTAQSANRAGYCNPRADQLLQAGIRELDPAAAKQTWAQFSQILQEDQPITPLYWTEELTGVGPALQGVETDPRGELVSVSQWWLRQ